MKTKTRSIQQIIEEQIKRWQLMKTEKVKAKQGVSAITISREPGSGGRDVAKKLAGKLGFEVFHQEVLLEIARRGYDHFNTSCPAFFNPER